MMYLERLGLWSGHRTSLFSSFTTFRTSVAKGGVGMMELTATHLKGSGSFLCRTLSFEQCTFEIVEETLSPNKTTIYDTAAILWQELWGHLQEGFENKTIAPDWSIASDQMNNNSDNNDDVDGVDYVDENDAGRNPRVFRHRTYYGTFFWGAHQRFFRSLLMSLKTDKLIELANNALNDDKFVVIGLQTTGEAEST